jgi:hypothetical protein
MSEGITFPKKWKELSEEEQKDWINASYRPKSRISEPIPLQKREIKEPKRSNTEKIDDSNISEHISLKIGMEPNAWGSKRRWQFLGIMARHIFEAKRVDFESFFVWATANCQCMKMRTLREDYLDTLERLGFIRIDWNTGAIVWKGENNG